MFVLVHLDTAYNDVSQNCLDIYCNFFYCIVVQITIIRFCNYLYNKEKTWVWCNGAWRPPVVCATRASTTANRRSARVAQAARAAHAQPCPTLALAAVRWWPPSVKTLHTWRFRDVTYCTVVTATKHNANTKLLAFHISLT